MRHPRFDDLPLFAKLLVPFVALIVIVGAFGAFLIVRDLSSRARATLDQSLVQASLNARAALLERELYLLESANLAANLEGMFDAVSRRDAHATASLLRNVIALKTDLDLVAVVTRGDRVLVAFTRADEGTLRRDTDPQLLLGSFVAEVLESGSGEKQAGLLEGSDGARVAIAAPVCPASRTCDPAGIAVVALDLDEVATRAAGSETGHALAIFSEDGRTLTGASGGAIPDDLDRSRLIRRSGTVAGEEVYTLYAPFSVQGRDLGSIAVSLPTEPAFESVRDAGLRLALVLLVALAGIVGVGALLSRRILRQIRSLVETNRALGGGDLRARAPAVGRDEIGELSRGLNEMAEQLQASHESLEERVAERTAEVEQLLAERTEFFASLSHELRTPIAVIIHEASMINAAHGGRGRWWRAPSASIRDSAEHLLGMVNDILDLARLEVGGFKIDLTPVSIYEVLEDVRGTADGLAARAQLGLTYRVATDLPKIRADRQRIREVVLNLIDNAVKYTPGGGTVELAATCANSHVDVIVRDYGVGIPPESLARIFEPFYRAPGVEPQHGEPASGLGLALARRLIVAQGGEILVESKPDAGSAFTIRFPALSE